MQLKQFNIRYPCFQWMTIMNQNPFMTIAPPSHPEIVDTDSPFKNHCFLLFLYIGISLL